METWLVNFIYRTPSRKKVSVVVFTVPIHMVWFLIEEHLSVIHTSHVSLVCVPCKPYGSTLGTCQIGTWLRPVTVKANFACMRSQLFGGVRSVATSSNKTKQNKRRAAFQCGQGSECVLKFGLVVWWLWYTKLIKGWEGTSAIFNRCCVPYSSFSKKPGQ